MLKRGSFSETDSVSKQVQVISIPISDALQWTTAPNNLYIKLADGRFLALFRKSAVIDQDRLQKYVNKGVTTLYATEQELTDAVAPEAPVVTPSTDPKLEVLTKLSNVVFDELKRIGISEESFNHAKAVGKAVRGMLEKDLRISEAIVKFQQMQPGEVRHSIMVSALSTILAGGMDWIKPATIENIGLGAVLHDLGKLTLPTEILQADPSTLSPNDQKILEGHCEAGRTMLAQLKTVPEEVTMIVAHHHERSDGSGYPLGLKDIYIHPLARVVAISNEIVDRFEREQEAGRTQTIKQLIEATLNASASRFNRDIVKALTKMAANEKI